MGWFYATEEGEMYNSCLLYRRMSNIPHTSSNLPLYGESSNYSGLRISSMQAIKVDQQGIQRVYIMVRPGQTDREIELPRREQYNLVSFHNVEVGCCISITNTIYYPNMLKLLELLNIS